MQRAQELGEHRQALVNQLLVNLHTALSATNQPSSKQFRQLLTLTLSALAILQYLGTDPLPAYIDAQLPKDVEGELRSCGALEGQAQSGNQAMFLAIFLLHAQRYLGRDIRRDLRIWVQTHQRAMNRFGFWGAGGLTHLHVQNGYHQYEIFEYVAAENPKLRAAMQAVVSLADPEGHFAPHPGGGSCFDYDAVFVLTPEGRVPDLAQAHALLRKTANTIVSEQNADGGFCESRRIRPRMQGLHRYLERLTSARNSSLLTERLRYALTLQRPKHDTIRNHWSEYPREWGASDLFSSWFRLLTLARIECAFDPERAQAWGFIEYPGIGWHPSLRKEAPLK